MVNRDWTRIDQVLSDLHAYGKQEEWRGYNKHDGLNSPLLRPFFNWGKWPRLLAIQGVMRFPFNLRPLLLVPKTPNPKGLALFSMGFFDCHRVSGLPSHLAFGEELLSQLVHLRSPLVKVGMGWGYPYPWRDAGFFAPTDTPNAVVTSFVCEAFLDGYLVTGNDSYLKVVGLAIDFMLHDLTVLKDTPEELCLGYMPLPMRVRVMDVSILIGAVIARYCALSGDLKRHGTARRLVTYVVRRQTADGAWFYTDPPEDSHIRHDNYHTGFILDALWRYMSASQEDGFMPQYEKGLAFYAKHLFNEDGSPRWMSDCDYPHDIHGAAQGILTFSRHEREYPGLAGRIADWALDHMYHPDGRFYYQQGRFFTRRFTLLRWCNAWMARALARFRAT